MAAVNGHYKEGDSALRSLLSRDTTQNGNVFDFIFAFVKTENQKQTQKKTQKTGSQ